MRLFLIFLSITFSFYSCRSSLDHFDDTAMYLPTPEHLKAGIVNKYYFHYWSDDGYEKTTDIRYYKYKQLDEQRLILSMYNPGFELTARLILRLQDDKLLVEDEIRHYRGEHLNVQLGHNVYLSWVQDSAKYSSTLQYPYGIIEKTSWEQLTNRDSVLMDRPAKVITRQRNRHYEYPDQEDRDFQAKIVNTYVQGFGLFSSSYDFDDGTGSLELIKQMPSTTFDNLSKKVPPRVAYIDPNNTLDAFSNFAPCNDKGQIYDYYNGDPAAHFSERKRGLWEVFSQQLDLSLLGKESGYLTFRFVINCAGETGWFVTEEVDLDFNIKTFPEATVSHLYELIRNLDSWQPAIIREEAVDVYAYLTLKMKDGEIIEILP